ncbi:Yip1 family protein [Roseovarius sp. E0-M6]|uniref:Yip1 family protein n=1 Tax=Roseovarius sp. E0-M6 TaxID=3127118 RepID=UPI00300FEAFB
MTARALFIDLFRQTLTEPRAAGARVIAMGWPPQILWLTLGLIAVAMSLAVSGILQAAPLPEGEMGEMLRLNPAYRAPLLFALMQWGQAVISVFVLTWIGRAFGGEARVEDMLAVTIWLQLVAIVLGIGVVVITVLLPPIGAFALLAFVAWSIFIMLAMIDAAHRFDNFAKALGVFVVAIVALAVGSAMLAALIGAAAIGGV